MERRHPGAPAVRIVIVGAGAVGSILAAHLARGGEEVVCVARGRRAAQLREHGIRITGLKTMNVPVEVVEDTRTLRHTDVLAIATKSYDSESALASVAHMDVRYALSLQNGVYKDEQVARVFGAARTLGAVAAFGGEVMPDGELVWTIYEQLNLGVLPHGRTPEVDAIGAAIGRHFRCEVSPNILTVEWSKYVIFVGLLALSVITRLETYRMLQDPDLAVFITTLYREMAALAAKLGIPLEDGGAMSRIRTVTSLPFDEAVEDVRRSGAELEARGATRHKVSTLQDIEHGRRLEIEEILGYALRKGAELGVPLPTVDMCYRVLTGIDRQLAT
jgi:2-dehydropantoate 2-reductase